MLMQNFGGTTKSIMVFLKKGRCQVQEFQVPTILSAKVAKLVKGFCKKRYILYFRLSKSPLFLFFPGLFCHFKDLETFVARCVTLCIEAHFAHFKRGRLVASRTFFELPFKYVMWVSRFDIITDAISKLLSALNLPPPPPHPPPPPQPLHLGLKP